ncbi:methyl-accepting chemotaxis protein [Roseospira goensis]|uniref:Methyl-accepting chemotaxis protein n=1 Tax=Roseospira goensis TaxID=391922 RepID=A0A7W6S0K4_9PROT|nr:methyl-accepting chemotaxis protein [Roseospira goensis]MBB4286165.1 methyl-accepting chemotaxis protein [Roseospira goensis]
MGLKGRLSAVTAGLVLAALVLAAVASVYFTRTALTENARALSQQAAETGAAEVKQGLEQAFTTARDYAILLETARAQDLADRSLLLDLQSKLLQGNRRLLGVWSGFEPDALDGQDAAFAGTEGHDSTGRFVPYTYRDGDRIAMEPLLDYDVPGAGDYYLDAFNSGRETILEPYPYEVGGKETLLTSLVVPVRHDGAVIGVAGVDIGLGAMQRYLAAIRPMEDGWISVLTGGGMVVADRHTEALGQPGGEAGFSPEALAAVAAGDPYVDERATAADGTPVLRVVVPFTIGQTESTWAVATSIPLATALATAQEITWTLVILTVVVALVALVLAWLSARQVSSPIVGMTGAMERLAEGDLETAIPARERKDEIGRMAHAVQVFKENAQRVKEMEAEQAAQAARTAEEKKQAMHTLADTFESSVGGVVEAVAAAATELQSTAESMASIAEETNSQATTVAAASEQASTNVQTVASAAEELSSSISEIGRQVQQASDVARKASDEAERTNAVVSGLADAAQKIGDVVNLISDIADQTNLLALNATIEAARAGDAGKGFAVVANEVKSLANQTAKATEDIGQQIGSVQSETRTAVTAIESISGIIQQINEVASAIAAAMEEQNAATEEIARNVQQASQGTTEVSQTIVGVTEAARESGSAAESVVVATNSLNEQSAMLKQMVERFLVDVRQS